MKITIESIIREYLINKDLYDEMIVEMIHKLNNEIQTFSKTNIQLSDVVLPAPAEVPSGKTNNTVDASYSVLARYNSLVRKIEEENNMLINEKLDYLYYLTDIKKLFGQISFVAITLEPKKNKAIKILMNGGKVCEVGCVLGVSYNTARRIVSAAVNTISESLSVELKKRIIVDYEKYSGVFAI